jgi:hypothetical protein
MDTGKAKCPICTMSLQRAPQSLVLLFLCRHVVHATCVAGGEDIPYQTDTLLAGLDLGEGSYTRALGAKIALWVFSLLQNCWSVLTFTVARL